MASELLYGKPVDRLPDNLNNLTLGESLLVVPESNDKLIIAIDFGTTFSGISYCFANRRDTHVVAITDWPGAEGHSVPKFPTVVKYDNPSDKNSFIWGASVPAGVNNVVGVKLLLDPSQKRPRYLPYENMLQDMKRLPKQPIEIAADFIGAAYRHALDEIQKEVPELYFKKCQKQLVMSVPAVWSDAAKNATQQAAKMAGIFPVSLIKEPEAAALYTIDSLKFALEINDTFVVCDAGGGTVDLISYEVVGQNPVLQLKELVPGTGGMVGSIALNHRFADAVKNLVGKEVWDEIRYTEAFAHALEYFERDVKRKFQGRKTEKYYVNFPLASIPDNLAAGLKSNCWTLTGVTLTEIFEPIIVDVLKLIDEQVVSVKIKKPGEELTGIFLVGGFGGSRYLKTRVVARYPSIKVLQPSDAWAAIVKGAGLSKVPRQASVISTCATKHYGVEAWSIYDSLADKDVPTKVWPDGSIRSAFMTWYINIGEDLYRDQVIRFSFYRTVRQDYSPDSLIFEDILYECQDSDAPRNRCKGIVTQNCKLVSDLRHLSKSQFKETTDHSGSIFYEIYHDIVVSVKSAQMTFSLEIDGRRMGSVEVQFD